MEMIYWIVLIAAALAGVIFILGRMSSNGEKIGNEETEKAEKSGKGEFYPAGPVVASERMTLREALSKVDEAFQDMGTFDIVELQTPRADCQFTSDHVAPSPTMVVTYVFKRNPEEMNLPAFVFQNRDGTLYPVSYGWPVQRDLLVSQLMEVMGLSLEDTVTYIFWPAE